jgi:hypothetical protein
VLGVEMFIVTKTAGQVWLHEVFVSIQIPDIYTQNTCFVSQFLKSFYELFCHLPLE